MKSSHIMHAELILWIPCWFLHLKIIFYSSSIFGISILRMRPLQNVLLNRIILSTPLHKCTMSTYQSYNWKCYKQIMFSHIANLFIRICKLKNLQGIIIWCLISIITTQRRNSRSAFIYSRHEWRNSMMRKCKTLLMYQFAILR